MTGFRLPLDKLRKRIKSLTANLRADDFKPELERFVTRSLKTAIDTTPARDAALIEAAQKKQYDNRINYIPSVHTVEDPTLIVNDKGEHWLFSGGKWFLANQWRINGKPQSDYMDLIAERNRRIQRIGRKPFVNDRKQARFLYKKSWWQVGQSLRLNVPVASRVSASRTRRRPVKEPPKGYGQWRGGSKVLSAVIYNPFLQTESRYKNFSGKLILRSAAAKHRPQFLAEVRNKFKKDVKHAKSV